LAGYGICWLLKAQLITPFIGYKIDQTTVLYLFVQWIAVA